MFPNKVDTFVGSKKFIKKLTALVFSSITYMRGIFPENAYMINELGGRQLKVLTGSYTNHNAYLMIRWLKSAFEALDRNYMRQLIFEILDQKNTPIEYYSVDFSYKGDEVTCSLASGTQTEK
ncbi:hypothetical protein AAG570_010696 [Ranatra chinensis]|uniref:HORMA domain-containing protein n=1 Tax=Ranatra chinensis TaxID=642074 RepID=A0ABD0YNB0_9HEMI